MFYYKILFKWLKARADQVIDQLHDLQVHFRAANYEPDEDFKKVKIERFNNESLPNTFQLLERLIEKQNTPFFAGDEVTYVDLNVAIFVDRFQEKLGDVQEKYPNTFSVVEKVNNLPRIAEWRAKRPETPF